MSKPFIHAKSSARRYGGTPDDYLDIHNWFDQTKSNVPDVRHRAILHSSFGIFLAEQMFGVTRVNSEGKTYSVRDIGEQHVMEDLGWIPTMERWLQTMPIEPWMSGKKAKTVVKVFEADPPEEPKKSGFKVSPGVSVTEYDDGTHHGRSNHLRPSNHQELYVDAVPNPFAGGTHEAE